VTDVLIYWRDYRKNAERHLGSWNTNARLLAGLQPGDRLWLVTSGKILRQDPEQARFLVAVWPVREVIPNPGDDAAYPMEAYRFRVEADAAQEVPIREPVPVDHILRPHDRDQGTSIGRVLQGPRKLKAEKVRLLKAAAGLAPSAAGQPRTERSERVVNRALPGCHLAGHRVLVVVHGAFD
jgi:hypothetical protein